jgi:hypothetical protein
MQESNEMDGARRKPNIVAHLCNRCIATVRSLIIGDLYLAFSNIKMLSIAMGMQ